MTLMSDANLLSGAVVCMSATCRKESIDGALSVRQLIFVGICVSENCVE